MDDHQNAQNAINESIKKAAKTLKLERRKGESFQEFLRRVWKGMTPKQRNAAMQSGLKAGNYKGKISKLLKLVKSKANTPGIKQCRKAPTTIYSTSGKVLRGFSLAIAGIAAVFSANEAVGELQSNRQCKAMMQAISDFQTSADNGTPDCSILQSAKSDASECLLSMGEAFGGNFGGVLTTKGISDWDDIVDDCNRANNPGCFK